MTAVASNMTKPSSFGTAAANGVGIGTNGVLL